MATPDPVAKWAAPARLLKALAHPVRLHLLAMLRDGTRCVMDLRELTGIPQPGVSQHLAILKEAGLVDSYSDGSLRCYHLVQPAITKQLLRLSTKHGRTAGAGGHPRHG